MRTMDRKLSLQEYESLYRDALVIGSQINQVVPKTVKEYDQYQDMCRVCGCHDDGHFVDLDKFQEFEFEPTIKTYRMLFQRTSLQFQFHTMPDLPTSICRICAYKVKIFYLMTRQFLIGQQIMRSAIMEFYRDKYGTEAPEQLEDLQQLHKLLNIIPKKGNLLISKAVRRPIKLKSSTSGDGRLITFGATDCGKYVGKLGKPVDGRKLTMSTMLVQQSNKTLNSGNKSPPAANNKKRLAEIRTMPLTERTAAKQSIDTRKLRPVQCLVTPRKANKSVRADEPTDSSHQGQTSQSDGRDMPLSKAQLQKKLLERRKQWR